MVLAQRRVGGVKVAEVGEKQGGRDNPRLGLEWGKMGSVRG